MTEVKGVEADRLLRTPPAHICVYLICGVDVGLISERVTGLIRHSVDDVRDPFQVISLDGNDVASDPNVLLDEVYTIGLFGGRRAVRVQLGSRAIHSTIETILKNPPPDTLLVIEGGTVKGDAPLRKLIASAKNAAVIECWNDDLRQLEALIDEEVSDANLSIEPAARSLLASLLGADRLATRSELAKLVLSCRGKTIITEDDVEMSVSNASLSAFDELVWHAFSGSATAINAGLENDVTRQDLAAIPMLMVRHCGLLHRLRSSFDGGQDLEAVIGHAYRVSFKRKAILKTQVRLWTLPALTAALDQLRVSSGRARREAHISHLLPIRNLWAVASTARRLGSAG